MARYDSIRLDEFDGVTEIVLDRPQALNALDQRMAEELCDALGVIERRADVRSVLLRGEGRAFSAGGDVKEMERSLAGNPAEFFEEPLRKIHEAALSIARLPRPVVGALHGFVSGAGFNLALSCDLLLCGSQTRFNQAFIRIGVVPDTGGTYSLPRLVGTKRAMEMFLLGDFIDAGRALELGIVNRVVQESELLAASRDMAQRLAQGPTRAYAKIKQLVHDSSGSNLREALDAERTTQLGIAASDDFREGVTAFLEKREARFQGR